MHRVTSNESKTFYSINFGNFHIKGVRSELPRAIEKNYVSGTLNRADLMVIHMGMSAESAYGLISTRSRMKTIPAV